MDTDSLRLALRDARTRDQWVDLVAAYFAERPLFFGHGTDCAADEAWWLVWQLSGQPDDLAVVAAAAAAADRVAELAARRADERVPLAYLLGSAWFAGLEFAIEPGVLVPRSPLAEVIESGFEPWVSLDSGDRVLEIGTGSGCIAIAAAVLNPDIAVDASEVEPLALELARRNARRHGVEDRIRIVAADLFPPGGTDYRVIISNPPYVPTASVARLPAEYGHEPAGALDGGEDGLDVVRRILDGAGSRLAPNGVLIVEVGEAAEALMAAFPRVPWTWIEFERGGDGVFVLTAEEVNDGWG